MFGNIKRGNIMIETREYSLRLTVSQTATMLAKAYTALIKSKTPFKTFPSVMLWGPPGVGKSQGVRQTASKITEETGKRVVITDVRLLLFNPVDLRGIPTANEDRTLAVWLKPKIFQMDESEDVVNILFLDEISAAPQSVQAAAYQITLDRTVGEHRLPENCIVMAAGNRVTDRSVAYTMPKALANRLCHIEIADDSKSWHDWAVSAGINKIVLGFIDYNPGMLMGFEASGSELAFPTPRSWEMVSNILNNISENIGEVFPLISGCIGESAAFELLGWSEIYRKIPDVKDIFEGEAVSVPHRPEALFALSADIPAYFKKHHSKEEAKNAVKYAAKMPPEFRNRIFTDFLQVKPALKYLSNISEFDDWFLRSKREWADYGI